MLSSQAVDFACRNNIICIADPVIKTVRNTDCIHIHQIMCIVTKVWAVIDQILRALALDLHIHTLLFFYRKFKTSTSTVDEAMKLSTMIAYPYSYLLKDLV